jgi:hypothetical protein
MGAVMRKSIAFGALLLVVSLAHAAQDKASVGMDKPGPFHPGDPITFTLKLNAPMPKDAYLDLRISPVTGEDQQVNLGSGEPVDATRSEYRVKGTIPAGALPGEWHINIIYLFLSGTGWTNNTIRPNDVRFRVQSEPYTIPTTADVTVGR